ncbi:Alpha-1,3-mannosyltransferase-like protein, partial [Serendipita sp. 399]
AKKNIKLAIDAFAMFLRRVQSSPANASLRNTRLVIAGGYDPRLKDNRDTLESLFRSISDNELSWCLLSSKADQKESPKIPDSAPAQSPFRTAQVVILPNFSTAQRTVLLTSSSTLALLYTPKNEHFGIVPVEAMACGVPVLACDSGGPKESILDDDLSPRRESQDGSDEWNVVDVASKRTGWLRPPQTEQWAEVLFDIASLSATARSSISDRSKARARELFSMEAIPNPGGSVDFDTPPQLHLSVVNTHITHTLFFTYTTEFPVITVYLLQTTSSETQFLHNTNMDFKAALARNVKPFVPTNALPALIHRRVFAPQLTSDQQPSSRYSPDSFNVESTSKRRRRRRNNAAKQLKHVPDHIDRSSPALDDNKEEESVPMLRFLQASPSPPEAKVASDPEDINVEFLRAVAERARERLASRIQAHWEAKQQVVEAASRIQQAYSTHIESQLQIITDAMEKHLDQEVNAKFLAYDERHHQKLEATLADIRVEMSYSHKQEGDVLRNHGSRIDTLEAQVQKILESLNGQRATDEESNSAVHLDSASEIQQRIDQLYSLFHGLRSQYQEAMILVKEMQTFISSSGLVYPTKSSRDGIPSFGVDETASTPRIFPESHAFRKTQQERASRSILTISPNPNLNKENVSPRSFGGSRNTSAMYPHRVSIDDFL